MKPQIIGLSGSPIKNSNTDRLIQAVLESSGLPSEFVKLSNINVRPGIACLGCKKDNVCMDVLGQLKATGNPECMVCGYGQSCPMSALPWIFGDDTEVTADKFSNVEDQTETWEQAEILGRKIARKLGDPMRM